MEAKKQHAVPLCLPENWTFDGIKAVGDKLKCRGSMKLCTEGKRVLEEIGDDEVAVICITGPARSGKSYLLSKLVDGVSFEVGHGVVSKTTGIWIACSQGKEETEGEQKVRIVLLDAEGAGAVSTEDDSVSREWDTKLYSLCCLLSSVMIYNSKKIPESVDLERLQFVANFSSTVCSADKVGACFKTFAPKLLWILRDVLTNPEPFKDWNEYFDQKVLVKRPERSQSDVSFNDLVDAINTVFHSVDVKTLPPPSNKPIICKNLDHPEYFEDIKDFLAEIEDLKRTIFKLTPIKTAGPNLMSGKDLLSVLEHYVTELNKEHGEISIRTCWEATVSFHVENVFRSSHEELERKVLAIKLPLTEQDIQQKCTAIAYTIERKFLENIVLRDEKVVNKFLQKLKEKVNDSLEILKSRNIDISRRFCQTKIKEIIMSHFEKIRQDTSSPSIIDQLKLYKNVMEKICQNFFSTTKGLPGAKYIFQKEKTEIHKKIEKEQQCAILIKICENYKVHMERVNFPVEFSKLSEINQNAKLEAFNSCPEEEKFITRQNIPAFERQREDRIFSLFQQFQAKNANSSEQQCKQVMNDILQALKAKKENPSLLYYFFPPTEEKLVKNYHKKAIGPQKTQVEMELREKLKDLLPKVKTAQKEHAKEVAEVAGEVGKKALKWASIAGGVAVAAGVVSFATVFLVVPAVIAVGGIVLKVMAF